MVHVVQGVKYWDMCGVDALIKSRLGVTSTKDRKKLMYDDKAKDFTMKEGIIMSRSAYIYELIYKRMKNYLNDLRVEKVGDGRGGN